MFGTGVDHGTCVAFTLSTASADNIRLLGLTDVGYSIDASGSAEEVSDTDDVGGVIAIESDTEDETDAEPAHVQELQWLDATGQVTVEQHILQMLEQEIAEYVVAAKSGKIRKSRNVFPCPACPFRTFGRSARLVDHLQKHHTSRSLDQHMLSLGFLPSDHGLQ